MLIEQARAKRKERDEVKEKEKMERMQNRNSMVPKRETRQGLEEYRNDKLYYKFPNQQYPLFKKIKP